MRERERSKHTFECIPHTLTSIVIYVTILNRSVDMLQSALEGASKAGLDSDTREAASEAARLIANQTSISKTLRGAIASRSVELLEEAIRKANHMLSQPTPPLSPAQPKGPSSLSSSSSFSSSSGSSPYETSLRTSLMKSDETLTAGRNVVGALLAEAVSSALFYV
jgi:hypothetical protein